MIAHDLDSSGAIFSGKGGGGKGIWRGEARSGWGGG